MTSTEWRHALGRPDCCTEFSEAEVLDPSDVHVAQRLTALAKETDETVALALALAVRALRNGSLCWTCGRSSMQVGVDGLPWPESPGG